MALTENKHTGEFILSEANGKLSRDEVRVVVPGSTTLYPGHVLAKKSADDKYYEYDNAGSDGTESASGILYDKLVNDSVSAAEMDGVIVNKDAEVRGDDLQWKSGLTAGDKVQGKADLRALGIKCR